MKEKNIFILSLIFLFLFLFIALNINNASLIGLDEKISSWAVNNQNDFLRVTSIFISVILDPIYVIIFVILLSAFLFFKSKRRQAILLSASSLLAGVAIYLLKHIFLRARPIGSIIQETGFSFPSGHAMIAMTMFGVFMYFSLGMKSQSKKIFYMIVCILAIIVVGFSRIYLNVHWFSDVIASYCFGLFILFLVLFGERAIKKF